VYLDSPWVYNNVVQQLGLPEEGGELSRSIDVEIVGYNGRAANWLDDQRSRSSLWRFVPAPPEAPPLIEIQARHADKETALQISRTMVNVINESPQEGVERRLAYTASYTVLKVRDLTYQLVLLGENPRYEAERDTLQEQLDEYLRDYLSEVQKYQELRATGFRGPLRLLEPFTIQTYPRRWLGLIVGGVGGLVVGLAAVMVRRYWVD
jgi:hypothetical protein